MQDKVGGRRELGREKALGVCIRVSPSLWLSPAWHMQEKTHQNRVVKQYVELAQRKVGIVFVLTYQSDKSWGNGWNAQKGLP